MNTWCFLAIALLAKSAHDVRAQSEQWTSTKTRSMQQNTQNVNCSASAEVRSYPPTSIIQGPDPLGVVGIRGISFSIGYSVIDSIKIAQDSQPADEACRVQTARVINRFGKPVPATTAGAQAAVRGTNFNDKSQQSCPGFGLCANIWDGAEQDVYPISTLTYVVVRTVSSDAECSGMKVVYDYISWVLFSSDANAIATSVGFATMPKKIADLAKSQVLDSMTCGKGASLRYVKDVPAPSSALVVKGSGSSLQAVLQRALLEIYESAGTSENFSYECTSQC
jgi:hypothetical protein